MKVFLLKLFKFLLMLLIPGILIIALYIKSDPFRVVRNYDLLNESAVPINRDYVSTELYLNQNDKYNYDSFIFGSSRTISIYADSWKNHLEKSSVPFKFDASKEGLYGIYTKLKYLDSKKTKINNVLIFFCRSGFDYTYNFGQHLVIKHPEISKDSWIKFHFSHLKSFINLRFLMGYYYYILTGKQNSLTNGIIQVDKISLDYKTNQVKLDVLEFQIKQDSLKYYSDRKKIFDDVKNETYLKKNMINELQVDMLKGIKDILQKNNTNYKIIITPIRDQIKLSKQDMTLLKSIYGNKLYDFTGRNFITKNNGNWYEVEHFRPFIGDSIMNIIYKN